MTPSSGWLWHSALLGLRTLPSDFLGVAFVALDGAWRFELAREIRAAGIQVELNLGAVATHAKGV
jgi:hypothetical protein